MTPSACKAHGSHALFSSDRSTSISGRGKEKKRLRVGRQQASEGGREGGIDSIDRYPDSYRGRKMDPGREGKGWQLLTHLSKPELTSNLTQICRPASPVL